METITAWVSTVFYFLLVLGVLVLVHELGHFVLAKRAGVRVEEFGFGYPPRALTLFRRGDTAYTLNWLPLGGFVRMTGEEDPGDPRSFAAQPPWVRALILVAGAAMNVVLAAVLYTAVAMIGMPTVREFVIVEEVSANSPAAFVRLQPGDRLLNIDGFAIKNREDLLRLTYERVGQQIAIEVQRGRENVVVHLTPRSQPPKGEGPIGIRLAVRPLWEEMVSYPLWEAVPLGIQRTLDTGTQIFTGLRQLVQGAAPGQVGGPVEIARITGVVAQAGWIRLMELTAILSVNLAILNLFPFPALDGGRLLFVVLEAVRGGRRIVAPEKEALIHVVGMAILLILIAIITFNDVQRLLGG